VIPLEDVGPRDAEVVVLLHGWPVGPAMWRRLAPLLATRFRVVTPELRDAHLVRQADQVRDALASLAIERYGVVGHGHGGGLAQLLALGEPAPATAVLLDPIAFDVDFPSDLEPRALLERGAVEFASIPEGDLDAYLAFDAPRPEPIDLGPAAERLGASDIPIMLLWGEEDPFIPVTVAERLTDALPAATLGLVPESGHFLLDDAFESVGDMILQYLRVRYQGAPHGHDGIVRLQLERRPPWVDLAPYLQDDEEPAAPAAEQEVGPHA
jgi:pimeloyl-ACP methyl ester carboxylesterase